MTRTIEALAAIRSSRFDLPLTYDAGELALQVGDVVRVPLGTREMLAFVVSPPCEETRPQKGLRAVIERVAVPRAFDETGLHLARFVAEQYLCTLGEALGAVVLAGAIPRMRDVIVRTVPVPNPQRYPSVPPRLVRLIWEELGESFPLDALVRHPESAPCGRSRRAAAVSASTVAERRAAPRPALRAAEDARVSRPRPRTGRT